MLDELTDQGREKEGWRDRPGERVDRLSPFLFSFSHSMRGYSEIRGHQHEHKKRTTTHQVV